MKDPVNVWEHHWRPGLGRCRGADLRAVRRRGHALRRPRWPRLVTEPLALGVVAGLVLGKTLGVFGGAYLTARFTRAELAADLQVERGRSRSRCSPGSGFTVALLIADLAFAGQAELQDQGKAAVLFALARSPACWPLGPARP